MLKLEEMGGISLEPLADSEEPLSLRDDGYFTLLIPNDIHSPSCLKWSPARFSMLFSGFRSGCCDMLRPEKLRCQEVTALWEGPASRLTVTGECGDQIFGSQLLEAEQHVHMSDVDGSWHATSG